MAESLGLLGVLVESLGLVTLLWVLRKSWELLGLSPCWGETWNSHVLWGLEESAIAGGLGHGDHLQLYVVPGGLGLGNKDGDLLVGLGSGHWLEQWRCDLLRVLGQLLGLDLGDQVVAELLGAGIFWQGF